MTPVPHCPAPQTGEAREPVATMVDPHTGQTKFRWEKPMCYPPKNDKAREEPAVPTS
jgi:hypothetical protein